MIERASIVVVVAMVAVVIVWAIRRRPVERASLGSDLGPFPVILFFGDATCASCVPVRAALESAGVAYRSISWETDAATFERLGVEEVPTVWAVDRRGAVRHEVRGRLGRVDLFRLKSHIRRK